MQRILLILAAICICGWKWFLLIAFRKAKPDALTMTDHWWGFRDPNLVWDTEGSFRHRATDFLVEWAKLRGQRTAKLGSFVILVLAALAIAGWAA